ncbi:patatin-like phospholipase family protein [Rhodococcus sp. GXMU-t2271]|uniref:Patatin-like phospholipase family protein n=1 Tax=Rhodococcus indonesiensis TaxID=3055869 RepID=A0ABT7RS56_9NOCA|nr:patatin-like phospholipase family protein [Rhodococcus indonesiensis]MDM7490464.1 patatin-like phospholipase family protein [Rhodococcus indonesiensis]
MAGRGTSGTHGRRRSALVVAGAGARGAYQAGAITTLLPRMTAHNGPPELLVGTSAGAINVVGLAAFADEGFPAASERLVDLWTGVDSSDVYSTVHSILGTGAAFVGQALGFPLTRLVSLLDTSPIRHTLQRLLPWDRLHENIRAGLVDAVAVATTSVDSGGTVVFVEKNDSVRLPEYDLRRNISYVETTLTVDHLLASSAVPILFRPVHITDPCAPQRTGWYIDGGLLLNTPIKPALLLGAGHVGVVATQPRVWPPPVVPRPNRHRRPAPDVAGVAALALRAMLGYRMIEDLHQLEFRNARIAETRAVAPTDRPIGIDFAGPPLEDAGRIAEIAHAVVRNQSLVRQFVRNPAPSVVARLIGGDEEDRGDLLSFLLFDPEFTRAIAELGREHGAEPSSAQAAAALRA